MVPNEQSLVGANSQISTAKLSYNNSKTLYDRNKALFDKGVISRQDFENSELALNQAKETLSQAQNNYQIIKRGSFLVEVLQTQYCSSNSWNSFRNSCTRRRSSYRK